MSPEAITSGALALLSRGRRAPTVLSDLSVRASRACSDGARQRLAALGREVYRLARLGY